MGGPAFADRTLHLVRAAIVIDCLGGEFDPCFDFGTLSLGGYLSDLAGELLKGIVQKK